MRLFLLFGCSLSIPVLTMTTMTTARAQGPGILATTTSFERVYAIVPLIGRGTNDDPVRPMFVPAGGFRALNQPSILERAQPGFAKPRTGIVSYTSIPTDDGKSAIVEFVMG